MDLFKELGYENSRDVALARALVQADHDLIAELVRIRQSKGLSQKDVAERIGSDAASISRFESGERDPHLSTIRRYAMAIGASIAHNVEDDDNCGTIHAMSRFELNNTSEISNVWKSSIEEATNLNSGDSAHVRKR